MRNCRNFLGPILTVLIEIFRYSLFYDVILKRHNNTICRTIICVGLDVYRDASNFSDSALLTIVRVYKLYLLTYLKFHRQFQ